MHGQFEKTLGCDPLELLKYLHKYVNIKMHHHNEYSGVVYTIDPVSQSIICVGIDESTKGQIYLIRRENVKSLEIEGEVTEKTKRMIDALFEPLLPMYSEAEMEGRKTQVEAFLQSRMIPVSYTGAKMETFSLFDGILLIDPPYEVDNCQSSNGMVLKQIQKMMKQLTLL